MGEKIRVVSKVDAAWLNFDVELNDGSAASKRPLHIHLQNDHFRLDFPDYDFLKMAFVVRAAGKELRRMKRLEESGNV